MCEQGSDGRNRLSTNSGPHSVGIAATLAASARRRRGNALQPAFLTLFFTVGVIFIAKLQWPPGLGGTSSAAPSRAPPTTNTPTTSPSAVPSDSPSDPVAAIPVVLAVLVGVALLIVCARWCDRADPWWRRATNHGARRRRCFRRFSPMTTTLGGLA